MRYEYLIIIFALGLAAALTVILKSRKERKEAEIELDEDSPEPEPVSVRATAAEMRCGLGPYESMKRPSTKPVYAVRFETDTGGDVLLEMSEDEYLSITEGSRGLLVYMNDKFIAFDTQTEI